MKLISEERQNGTLQLLFSSPVSMTQIVLGKYLGALLFFSLIILQISLMPLSLLLGANLDLGKFAAGMLAQFLNIAAFIALGLYMSSLSRQPGSAAVGTYGILIMLWIINIAGSANTGESNFFNYLSITHHSIQMLRGIVQTADLAYFLLFSFVFIVLSIRQLDAQRLQH